MKKLIILFLITFNSFANFEPVLKTIKISEQEIQFSNGCEKCKAYLAYKSFKKSDLEKIRPLVFGGRTWGDQICIKTFKQNIRVYKDKGLNEANYCFFDDKSYISSDQLSALAFSLLD